MAKGDHSFNVKPKGSTVGGYARPRMQVGFDDYVIKEITARAKSNARSFAAEVRDLVHFALSRKPTSRKI